MPADAHCHDADDEWASAGNLGETWIDTDQELPHNYELDANSARGKESTTKVLHALKNP